MLTAPVEHAESTGSCLLTPRDLEDVQDLVQNIALHLSGKKPDVFILHDLDQLDRLVPRAQAAMKSVRAAVCGPKADPFSGVDLDEVLQTAIAMSSPASS